MAQRMFEKLTEDSYEDTCWKSSLKTVSIFSMFSVCNSVCPGGYKSHIRMFKVSFVNQACLAFTCHSEKLLGHSVGKKKERERAKSSVSGILCGK